jgi:chemotaxis-related protein WspB
MLYLVFQLGADRYALEVSQIIELLPLVDIRRIPQAPAGMAGVFDCRGTPVPVIDLSELILGTPARRRLSTRVIVVHYDDHRGNARALGLIAEQATDTLRRAPADFVDPGIGSRDAAYLGPVTRDGRGLVQRIEVSQLLSAAVRDALFNTTVDQEWPSPASPAS